VYVIYGAMTRKPAFTASGILPLCLARPFFSGSGYNNCPSVESRSTHRFSRRSGNATTGMIHFITSVSFHIGDMLWLHVRLHSCCIGARSDLYATQ
jgi:hypothetical protein